MKTIVVLSKSLFFVFVASIHLRKHLVACSGGLVLLCFVASMSCGGGADSPDENTDSADVSEDADNPVCGDGVCEADEVWHCMVDCDGADSADSADVSSEADAKEDCPVGCECCADYDDCACWKWPQTVEYMWLVRQWKRIEVDGKPADKIVDVTIEAWDDSLGAEVHTFSPYGPPYPYLRFKKNAETGQFEAINPETKQVVGYGDPVLLKIEYDSTIEVGVTHHSVWTALD